MNVLIVRLAKEICASLICQKACKCLGKKDYADVIRLGGWCLYGQTIVLMTNFLLANSKVVNFFIWLGKIIAK